MSSLFTYLYNSNANLPPFTEEQYGEAEVSFLQYIKFKNVSLEITD